MKSSRLFLRLFLLVSWFFLCAFDDSFEKKILALETSKTQLALESVESEQAQKVLEIKHLKSKSLAKLVKVNPKIITPAEGTESLAKDNAVIERSEFDKPLDLSLPFTSIETSDYKAEKKAKSQSEADDFFALKAKKKPRSLELEGDFLMSPEPEVEKQKTVDGAGVVINLRP